MRFLASENTREPALASCAKPAIMRVARVSLATCSIDAHRAEGAPPAAISDRSARQEHKLQVGYAQEVPIGSD